MKIEFCPFSDQFTQVCEIAKRGNEFELKEYLKSKTANINACEYFRIGDNLRAIFPVSLLAYQGEDKAVRFLLEKGAKRLQALAGYALAGNLARLNENLVHLDQNDFYSIGAHLVFGGHFQQAFAFYTPAVQAKPFSDGFERGFALGMTQTGIAFSPQRLLKWFINHSQFKNHTLFLKLGTGLKDRNTISYNTLPLAAAAPHLSASEDASKNFAWPQLYVWLWQAPRLMQNNKLPICMFAYVASFLCLDDTDAHFLATKMPFLKTKQLFLSSLRSIAETKPQPGNELSEIEEKRLPTQLLTTFSAINNPQLFSAAIAREKQTQEDKRAETRSQPQSNTIPLFCEPPIGTKSDPIVRGALQRCEARLSRL